jgi:hypothetical protein
MPSRSPARRRPATAPSDDGQVPGMIRASEARFCVSRRVSRKVEDLADDAVAGAGEPRGKV